MSTTMAPGTTPARSGTPGLSTLPAVAWGERAVELLRRSAARAGADCQRAGALAVVGPRPAARGRWRCWLWGRIANTPELRARLGLEGDVEGCELVAHAYDRLGADACEQLQGTFVAVALDLQRGVASVARDHLGGRPLLYVRVGEGALLAEHERALLDALPSAPAPDRLALAQWIESATLPAGRTLFEGVRRVPPAHRVLLDIERGVTVEPYWRPRYEGTAQGSRTELAERLRESAFAAVARAAGEASKPALLLSGGLDSSCVAAGLAACEPGARPALALSGVFPAHPATDERELIEETARHTRMPLELIAFDETSSILAPALAHIERWSLPPATPNLFAWEPVMARARGLGVDAMLDGEGGDELFGFAPLLIADRLRAGKLLAAWRLTRRIPGVGEEADARMRVRALRVYGTSGLIPAGLRRRRQLRRALASTRTLLRAADLAALSELERDADTRRLDGPLWWQALARGLTRPGEAFGASAHLRREAADERIDRRHPFLFDLELLTLALRTPPELLFEARDRALLRDGLRGHVPEAVLARQQKSVFHSPLYNGLAADGALLARGPAERDAPVRAFVREQRLQELLEQASRPSDSAAARRLWQVGLADVWLRSLEDAQYPRRLRERALARA
jgi:asparagine synthase (glutamine-hydrolysing)